MLNFIVAQTNMLYLDYFHLVCISHVFFHGMEFLMVSSRILQLATCCYKTFKQFDFNVFNETMII